MVDNEQLGKELSFHIRQTESLLQKNEKLVHENIDLHRKVLLVKEVQEDLAHRNRMNQKTIRILLYKLRERHYAMKAGKQADEEEMKRLLCRQEQLPSSQVTDKKDIHHLNGRIEGTTGEMLSSAQEAMNFLYACLEDIEIEKVNNISKHQPASSETVSSELPRYAEFPRETGSIDMFRHLLRTAVSLRAVCQNAAHSSQPEGLSYSVSNDKAGVSVDDILKLPVESLCGNEKATSTLQNYKFVSSSAQTESMDLEERLALDMGQRLRSCGVAGATT